MMNRPIAQIVCLFIAGMSLFGGEVLAAKTEKTDPPSEEIDLARQRELLPVELRTYRIGIWVSFAADARLDQRSRNAILREISQAADRTYGQMWEVTIRENSDLIPAGPSSLSRLTHEEVRRRIPPRDDLNADPELEKVFWLTITRQGGRHVIAGREWDAMTRALGPSLSTESWDRRRVGNEAMSLIKRLFRPNVVLESIANDVAPAEAELRVWAGELPPTDSTAAQVRPRDLFAPAFRYRNTDRVVQRIQPVPWTYFVVEENHRGDVKATLASGFTAPLGGRGSRLVERVALKLNPHLSETALTLVPRQNETQPLIGHYVDVYYKTHRQEEAKADPLRLMTDRRGRFKVETHPEHAIVWLYVRSGDALLARLPFVPGVDRQLILPVAGDFVRLAVEGEIDMLRGELVDTIARRATLIALAKRSAGQDKWDDVNKYLAQIEQLPNDGHFRAELTAIRVSGIEQAEAAGNRSAASKIRRLSSETSELIERYLGEDKMRAVREELDELRQLQENDRSG